MVGVGRISDMVNTRGKGAGESEESQIQASPPETSNPWYRVTGTEDSEKTPQLRLNQSLLDISLES